MLGEIALWRDEELKRSSQRVEAAKGKLEVVSEKLDRLLDAFLRIDRPGLRGA
jgi:hypothetical protein